MLYYSPFQGLVPSHTCINKGSQRYTNLGSPYDQLCLSTLLHTSYQNILSPSSCTWLVNLTPLWETHSRASFISGQYLLSGTVLLSLDVLALFTNVPMDVTLKLSHKRLSMDTSMQSCQLSCIAWDMHFTRHAHTSHAFWPAIQIQKSIRPSLRIDRHRDRKKLQWKWRPDCLNTYKEPLKLAVKRVPTTGWQHYSLRHTAVIEFLRVHLSFALLKS